MSISYILDPNAFDWANIYCKGITANNSDIVNMNVQNFSADSLDVTNITASTILSGSISTGITGSFSSGSGNISNFNSTKITTNLNTSTGVNRNNLVVYSHDNLAPITSNTILTAQNLIDGNISIKYDISQSLIITLPTAVQLTGAIGASAMEVGTYFMYTISNNSNFICYLGESIDSTIFCRDVPNIGNGIPIQPNSSRTVSIYKKSNSFYICI